MKIDVKAMKKIIDKVYEKSISSNGPIIEIDEDYYWVISTDESVDLTKEPEKLGVGSLVDDYNELIKIIDDDNRFISVIDLDRIANVIKFISLALERL